jgi:hypothetical protein
MSNDKLSEQLQHAQRSLCQMGKRTGCFQQMGPGKRRCTLRCRKQLIEAREADIEAIKARIVQVEAAKRIPQSVVDPFIKAYEEYNAKCKEKSLTEAKAKDLMDVMDKALSDIKEEIETMKKNNINAEDIEKSNNKYLKYSDMRQNINTNCQKYKIIEFSKVYEIFPRYKEGDDSKLLVKPGNSINYSDEFTTKIPEFFFKEWETPAIDIGSYSHGDIAVATIDGNANSITIRINIFVSISYNADDKFGDINYQLNNFTSAARWSIMAYSNPIIVKVPLGKKLIWEKAEWNYKIKSDEKINKKIKSIEVNDFLNLYKKIPNK